MKGKGFYMKKDSSGVVVARVFLTIFLTIVIGLLCVGISLRATFFNLHTWRDFLLSDEFVDAIMDEAEIEDILDDPILEGRLDEDFFTDYYSFMMDELFEALETGDTDIDDDRFDDLYEEYLEDIVSDNAPRSEQNRLKNELLDTTYDTIEEALDDLDQSGFVEYMHTFDTGFKIFAAVMAVLSAVFIGIMVAISRNKFVAVRNTGIALTVSNVLNLIAVGGLGSLIVLALKEDSTADNVNELAASFFGGCTGKAALILVACLGLGIFLIVFGGISMKNHAAVNDEDDESAQYVLTEEQ